MSGISSIIITIYNRSLYLSEAIESVLAQTHPDFELIIWDDGSTDDSLRIAHHYAHKDKRIRVFTAPHQGRARSLHQAHQKASGRYVAWLDSDDRLHPTALAATAAVLDHCPDIGMVYTNYQTINAEGQIQGIGNRCSIPYSAKRLLVDFMTFHFRLIRRHLVEQVGGIDLTFPCAMDYDLCLKLSEITEVCHLPQILYDYRTHADSISQGQKPQQIDCARRAVENAIDRRGMREQFYLEVKPPSQFFLRPVKR